MKKDKAHSGASGRKNFSKTLVKAAFVAGLVVILIFAGLLTGTYFFSKSSKQGGEGRFEGFSFSQKLDAFDNLYYELAESGGEPRDIASWYAIIDSMEKSATGSEGLLSVLKRVRLLAKNYPIFMPAYLESAQRAVNLYPGSPALCAIAGEALMYAGGRNSNTLIEYAKVLQKSGALAALNESGGKNFIPIAFAFYAVSGALKDIPSAMGIINVEDMFSFLSWPERGAAVAQYVPINIDGAILQILKGDTNQADSYLIPVKPLLLERNSVPESRKYLDFLANYFYDFKAPDQAAEIWTKLGGTKDLARAADALYLAQNTDTARTLWEILTKAPPNYENLTVKGLEEQRLIKIISLYNLAGTSKTNAEKTRYIEDLFTEVPYSINSNTGSGVSSGINSGISSPGNPGTGDGGADNIPFRAYLYGTVLYTRTLPDGQAAEILNENPRTRTEPLLSLEKFRRAVNLVPVEKSIPDTWILIDENPHNEMIYHWASWYFDFQGRFDDTSFLLKKARRSLAGGSWIDFNEAVLQIRAGNYDDAAELLQNSLTQEEKPRDSWAFYANLGLLFERAHNFNRAYENFVTARDLLLRNADLSVKENRTNAALVYLKLASCSNFFGRTDEAKSAILEAGKFAPDNIKVRLAASKK